jgi:cystathionine beta-synthase
VRYCKEQTAPKTVVTFICDTGSKYLSKVYNDYWMADQGLSGRPTYGDLRDLISRPFEEHAVVAVEPGDPLTVAYARMRLYDVSQLAVLDGERLAGIVDEGDLLLAVQRSDDAFDRPVREVMTSNIKTVDPRTPIEQLMPIFEASLIPLVKDETRFHGLITRIDVLNFLRKKHSARRGSKEDSK